MSNKSTTKTIQDIRLILCIMCMLLKPVEAAPEGVPAVAPGVIAQAATPPVVPAVASPVVPAVASVAPAPAPVASIDVPATITPSSASPASQIADGPSVSAVALDTKAVPVVAPPAPTSKPPVTPPTPSPSASLKTASSPSSTPPASRVRCKEAARRRQEYAELAHEVRFVDAGNNQPIDDEMLKEIYAFKLAQSMVVYSDLTPEDALRRLKRKIFFALTNHSVYDRGGETVLRHIVTTIGMKARMSGKKVIVGEPIDEGEGDTHILVAKTKNDLSKAIKTLIPSIKSMEVGSKMNITGYLEPSCDDSTDINYKHDCRVSPKYDYQTMIRENMSTMGKLSFIDWPSDISVNNPTDSVEAKIEITKEPDGYTFRMVK